jgi:hypothetical protein
MNKFNGSFQDLCNRVAATGLAGEWEDQGNKKIFRAYGGGVLCWYVSTRTVQFQGGRGPREELQATFSGTTAAPKHAAPVCRRRGASPVAAMAASPVAAIVSGSRPPWDE